MTAVQPVPAPPGARGRAGFLLVAVLPNTFWIIFPAAVVITLGRQVLRVGRGVRF